MKKLYILSKNNQTGGIRLGVLILAVCVVFLAVFNLVINNALVMDGYNVAELKENIKKLEEQNKRMNIDLSKTHSPQLLNDVSAKLNLVKTDKINYLSGEQNFMAVR